MITEQSLKNATNMKNLKPVQRTGVLIVIFICGFILFSMGKPAEILWLIVSTFMCQHCWEVNVKVSALSFNLDTA